jgi:hypothetical protein
MSHTPSTKTSPAATLGALGGRKRWAAVTPEARSAAMTALVKKRWKKKPRPPEAESTTDKEQRTNVS